MRISGKLVAAVALGTIFSGFVSAQTVRPISPQLLRKPPVITRDGLMGPRIKLRRARIPLDTALAAQADMSGWTPITNGGATGSPLLLPFSDYGVVGVRGKDKQLYIASVDLVSPKLIDGGAWSAYDGPGQYIYCSPIVFTTETSDKRYAASCLFSDKGGKTYHQYVAYWHEPELAAYIEEGPPVAKYMSFEIPDSPGVAFWAGTPFYPGGTVQLPIAAWDGGMGLSTAQIEEDDTTLTATWSKQAFYAYAPPACGTAGDSICAIADGVGDKVSVFSFDAQKSGTTIKLRATLPPVPSGGGMKQGEASVVVTGGVANVFVRGKDAKLYMSRGSTSSWSFSNWTSLGGAVAQGAIPSCILFKGGISCAARAPDNRIYVRRVAINTNGL